MQHAESHFNNNGEISISTGDLNVRAEADPKPVRVHQRGSIHVRYNVACKWVRGPVFDRGLVRFGVIVDSVGGDNIIVVNVHDLLAHLAGIDYRFLLLRFDPQLALVEFAVPVVQSVGTILHFLGILFLFTQAERGYGNFKVEKQAVNLLIAGPALWLLGSIHKGMSKSCNKASTSLLVGQFTVSGRSTTQLERPVRICPPWLEIVK
ncbi:hypothetical protein K7X08_025010 [Anisodus acutangulus]|uniref:Uncharacterized protein n=1 Tax=Anisodus acutangulus TaxID=402998 RepID=A0A9Q1RFV4_9SOLA|nr:hypothetical protein K7X08_025010 [Anisodus acutangulus]